MRVAFLMPLLVVRKNETRGWWLVRQGCKIDDVHLLGHRDESYMKSVANLICQYQESLKQHWKPRLVFAGYSAGGYAAIALANYFGDAWTPQNPLPSVYAVVIAAGYGEGSLKDNNVDHVKKFKQFVRECEWNYWWVYRVVFMHAEDDTLSPYADMKYLYNRLKFRCQPWQRIIFHTISQEDANRDSKNKGKKRKRNNHGYFNCCFVVSPNNGGTRSFEYCTCITGG